MASTTKVNRARMFNLRETDVITEFMKINLHSLKASHAQGGPGASQKVSKVWERLTEEVNACGNGPRTSKQVKEKWRNMVKNAKSEVSAEKCSMRKTGGGPARPEMSQQSQSVASLFQTSASFHGVCSDADTVITNQDFNDSTYDIVDDNLLSSGLLSLCPLETLTQDVQDNMNMPSMSVTADETFTQQRASYPEGSATNAPSRLFFNFVFLINLYYHIYQIQ
ncbi:uncharacterized protein LOC132715181 [Ruditapes philippinarum]|uniref:uncharacterized protein LOC132715181 n=1 Tax=Ruditapes philippinarum TaxID=129788 RepID=UPI00295C12CA|nr:uncharacterized protein LOC132715181 [Ruditapes philippinarum]